MTLPHGWPTHEWAGDEAGHDCPACPQDSPWRCDKTAHTLGEVAAGLALMTAVRESGEGEQSGSD